MIITILIEGRERGQRDRGRGEIEGEGKRGGERDGETERGREREGKGER